MSIFIIAEIGINHNGDMSICKKLIDQAVDAKCDAVKFQKRTLEIVYSEQELKSLRESPYGKTFYDQKKGLEFELSEYKEIDEYCRKKNIHWFASAWDNESLKFLSNFNLKYNKIASAMIIDQDFLKSVAKEKKHTFISTGMSTIEDIEKAVNIFKKENCKFELMHCVSKYPCEDSEVNLNLINVLRDKFSCDVGYSGHENGIAISTAAAALGITSLERHITLDRSMYGSDQAASIEPNGLANLVKQVRKIELSMGDGQKKILESEKPVAKKLRAHIFRK
jgi:N-acetylneuraminate synthase